MYMLSIIEQYREYKTGGCLFCWRIVLCRSTQGNIYGNASDSLHFFLVVHLCGSEYRVGNFPQDLKYPQTLQGRLSQICIFEHYLILICVVRLRVEVGSLEGEGKFLLLIICRLTAGLVKLNEGSQSGVTRFLHLKDRLGMA